ncbi:catenin alpha-3 isoform X3 [Varanus komodoensis]|uniref:catenin alpha-3 isoform X3 n=1 Tax=Varanus komodoensis TaxID=61221 RepID=UPI001CF793F4|nr:catenin alpha-3 isoform X3 [Varanus komodoensis]
MAAAVPHMKIDPQNLQIQTRTVEKLLEPLIIQVTTLVNCPQNPSNKKKGCSKRARVILASVEEATWNLLDKGEKIAKEAPFFVEELNAALRDVRRESEALRITAKKFTDDPCYLPKREAVVQVARALLAAVTRLLILADMIDVSYLLQHLTMVQRTFASLQNISSKSELQKTYTNLQKELKKLDHLAYKRQQDLKSTSHRDDIAAARASLKKNSPLLLSICSACLEHSDIASLVASKDSVCNEIQNALDAISKASQGIGNEKVQPISQSATLGSALDELENLVTLDHLPVNEDKIRPSLEKRLEGIISGAALLADSSCTRDVHRERIITECNAIRQALQDLLSEYMNNADKKEKSNALNIAIDNMCKKTRDLRRQVANLACSVSTNEEGIKIVQMAASHMETLCPQVINAALALAARPKSQVVKSNMEMYKNTWENHIRVLTEAVDDITSIDDFLAVSESHILEDVNRCIIALREQDADDLDRAAGAIRGRAARVAHIVSGEMDNYEIGTYTEGVMRSVRHLTNTESAPQKRSKCSSTGFKGLSSLTHQVMPEFITQVNTALENLSRNTMHLFDDNQFVDISKKVYDTIHDIRCSVMMIRTPEELEDVSDFEDDHDVRSHTSNQTEGKTDRAKMTQLPEAEKEKIAEQVADFKKVKSKLDEEIEIWDDTSNDIIVLAKQMCVIMMEMTDFTRGRGPLKNTSDVINAAKMISESGSKMDMLARLISNQCPDLSCKQDLLAYLEQIKLYSHQLKICSQVKAEIQNLGGELIMSAVSANCSVDISLLQYLLVTGCSPIRQDVRFMRRMHSSFVGAAVCTPPSRLNFIVGGNANFLI